MDVSVTVDMAGHALEYNGHVLLFDLHFDLYFDLAASKSLPSRRGYVHTRRKRKRRQKRMEMTSAGGKMRMTVGERRGRRTERAVLQRSEQPTPSARQLCIVSV